MANGHLQDLETKSLELAKYTNISNVSLETWQVLLCL